MLLSFTAAERSCDQCNVEVEETAAMRLQTMHRRKTEFYLLSDARTAATSIQAAYRGSRARSLSRQRSSPSGTEADAAATIQAQFRGSRQRRETKRQTTTNALIEFMNEPDDELTAGESQSQLALQATFGHPPRPHPLRREAAWRARFLAQSAPAAAVF